MPMYSTHASCFSLLLLLLFALLPGQFASGVAAVIPADTKHQANAREGADGTWNEDGDVNDVNGRLADYLRKRVRKYTRPVLHPSERVDIHVSSALYQIVDLDQRNNLATISAYFDVWWIDPFLTWNPGQFGGVESTFLPTDMVWKPEFHLYHSIQGATATFGGQSAVEVHSSGRLRMFVPLTSRALCPINVKYFPFDTQKCSFQYGSWSYQSLFLRYIVETRDVFLGDFFDNQEWLLVDAVLLNGSTNYEKNETYSMVVMELEIRRQHFYYVFNLVIPTTLVSIVAVTGFHAPINSTSRRETKFRLGIMTLLSMAVMLLMLVDEMPKFARESIPGQRGSFSDVPLLGMFYISLIATISACTISTSIFVHVEKYALRNQEYEAIPMCLRWLTVKSLKRSFASLLCRKRTDGNWTPFLARKANNNQAPNSKENDPATEINYLSRNTERKPSGRSQLIASGPMASNCLLEMSNEDWLRTKLDTVLTLIRDQIEQRERIFKSHRLPKHWDRVIGRLEAASLTFFLLLICFNLLMFRYGDEWY